MVKKMRLENMKPQLSYRNLLLASWVVLIVTSSAINADEKEHRLTVAPATIELVENSENLRP